MQRFGIALLHSFFIPRTVVWLLNMSKHLSRFSHHPRAASGSLECPYEVITIAIESSAPGIAGVLTVRSQGRDIITSCQFNKGSAFSEEERNVFKLHGLLPPNIQTLEEQVQRAFQQYKSRPDALAKNTFMASMKAQNEVLYYKVRLCAVNFSR